MERIISGLEPCLTERRIRRMQEVLATRSDHVAFVFERMIDPHNFSAALRSMDAFSFQEAHMIEADNKLGPSMGPSMGLSRGITIGAERWLTLHRHQNTKECMEGLRKRGYRILASHVAQGAGLELKEIDFSRPTALVFGNEHAGVGAEALEFADDTFRIDMLGFVESFNLSVAAAISGFHARREIERLLPAKPAPEGFLLPEARRQEIYSQWLRQSVKRADQILAELEDK